MTSSGGVAADAGESRIDRDDPCGRVGDDDAVGTAFEYGRIQSHQPPGFRALRHQLELAAVNGVGQRHDGKQHGHQHAEQRAQFGIPAQQCVFAVQPGHHGDGIKPRCAKRIQLGPVMVQRLQLAHFLLPLAQRRGDPGVDGGGLLPGVRRQQQRAVVTHHIDIALAGRKLLFEAVDEVVWIEGGEHGHGAGSGGQCPCQRQEVDAFGRHGLIGRSGATPGEIPAGPGDADAQNLGAGRGDGQVALRGHRQPDVGRVGAGGDDAAGVDQRERSQNGGVAQCPGQGLDDLCLCDFHVRGQGGGQRQLDQAQALCQVVLEAARMHGRDFKGRGDGLGPQAPQGVAGHHQGAGDEERQRAKDRHPQAAGPGLPAGGPGIIWQRWAPACAGVLPPAGGHRA